MNSINKFSYLVVFDTETTGLDPVNDKIIELGVVKYTLQDTKYILTDEMDVLINIHEPLPSRITEITGITNQMLDKEGKEETEGLKEFYLRFLDTDPSLTLYIAYNAPFDILFLENTLKRYGISLPYPPNYLDILTVYKDRAQYPHRLFNAIEHYNLTGEFVNSHRAIDDCKATFAVMLEMAKEQDDLLLYVNLFGYNPKYPVHRKVVGAFYKPQSYYNKTKLYFQ